MPDESTPVVPPEDHGRVIDLGESRGVETGARRSWWGGGPRRWTPAVRFAVPLVVLLFLPAAAARAAPAPLPEVARVAATADDRVAVAGTRAFVVAPRTLREYDLGGGGGWTARTDLAAATGVDLRVDGGVAVLSTQSGPVGGVRTEAFDAASGRRLWRSADEVWAFGPTGDLALASTGAGRLRDVDVRTGATRASMAVTANCSAAYASDPAHGLAEAMVELCVNPSIPGVASLFAPVLRVVDLSDGAVRASRTLHLAVDPSLLRTDTGIPPPQLTVWRGLVVLIHTNIPFPMADAFRVAGLAPVWSGVAVADMDALQPCGTAGMCLATTDGVFPINDSTGALAGLAVPVTTPDTPEYRLVGVAGQGPGGALDVPRLPEDVTSDVPLAGTGSAWLGRTRPATDEVTLVERLPGVGAASCVQAGGYLACATTSNELTFWRLAG